MIFRSDVTGALTVPTETSGNVMSGEKCGICGNPVTYKCFWAKYSGKKRVYFCRWNHQVQWEKQHDKKNVVNDHQDDAPMGAGCARASLLKMQKWHDKAIEMLDKQPVGTIFTPKQFWVAFAGSDKPYDSAADFYYVRDFLRSQPLWLPMCKDGKQVFKRIPTLDELEMEKRAKKNA